MMTDAFLERFLPGDAFGAVRRTIWVANQDSAIALREPVLFLGEPGAGKSYAARVTAAHRQWLQQPEAARDLYLSRRNWEALIIRTYSEISLPTIPASLVESELFGHVRGAFSGANKDYDGIFGSQAVEDALLDEIGDVALEVQPKLLQVLQSGTFRPVGAKLENMKQTRSRILLATNRDLSGMVTNKQFREDLFYRVSQLVVQVPALRLRPEDIPAMMESVRASLLRTMADVSTAAAHRAEGRRFDDADFKWAKEYDWPGNTRTLERLVRLWLIDPNHVPLSQIAERYPIAALQQGTARAENFLRLGVESWIAEAKRGARKPPGTVGRMVGDMEHVVRIALTELKLSRAELELLFPEQDVENVRSRISRYRTAR